MLLKVNYNYRCLTYITQGMVLHDHACIYDTSIFSSIITLYVNKPLLLLLPCNKQNNIKLLFGRFQSEPISGIWNKRNPLKMQGVFSWSVICSVFFVIYMNIIIDDSPLPPPHPMHPQTNWWHPPPPPPPRPLWHQHIVICVITGMGLLYKRV